MNDRNLYSDIFDRNTKWRKHADQETVLHALMALFTLINIGYKEVLRINKEGLIPPPLTSIFALNDFVWHGVKRARIDELIFRDFDPETANVR